MPMQYRKFGKLGWDVSALGFGAMRLPTTGIRKKVDDEEAIRIIRYGIDRGINYVDTAYPYHGGNSERIVGLALKDGYREKVKLVTKLFMFGMRKEEDFDRMLNTQLERLQVESIDLYLLHSLMKANLGKIEKFKIFEKLEKAKAEGKIKAIGFSFHDTLPIFREIVDMYPWDAAQIQYNYMDSGQQATYEGLKYAHEKGLATIVMEPVKGGMLATPPAQVLDVMKKSSVQRSPVDWALQFVWNHPEVNILLSGMSNWEQVKENCTSAENSGVNRLSEEELKILTEIKEIYSKKILVPCTACRYCMPCPAGVNIPENFATINNISMLSGSSVMLDKLMKIQKRLRYFRMAKNKKQLSKKPNNGKASMCTTCKACIPKCPQHIDIPTELSKVVQILEGHKKISQIFNAD